MKTRNATSRTLPIRSGVYRHYKGPYYLVLGVARHSETEAALVVYVRLYARAGGPLWVRPLENFAGQVAGPKGKRIPRFKYVGLEQPA